MALQSKPPARNYRIPAHALQDLPLMRPFKANRLLQDQDVSRMVLIAGLLTGVGFFIYYYTHHLTIAHYDAKAHLLVARRMVDSLAPGYGQMGVNWLPLIHLVYLPFVMFDAQYRSGFLPSLISVCAFAFSCRLAYRISYRLTGSIAAALFAAIVLLVNPNLLYLQSCPLTEPLYMVLLLLATDRLISWRESDHSTMPWAAAVWTCLGALCRYEGWYFWAGVMLLLIYDFWTRYIPRPKALKAGAVFLVVFGVPVAAHFGYIFLRLGDNFFLRVAEGHPNPYATYKRPFLSLVYHLGELSQMAEILPLLIAAAGLLLFLLQRKEFNKRMPLVLLWLPSLINISALYWGLVYRVRYSVLLLPAVAIFGSLVITSITAKKLALLLLVVVAMGLPWFTWHAYRINPADAPLPGPGALVVPAAALVLFLIARAQQWYNGALIVLCVLGMQIPPLAREDHPMMVETMEHEFIETERGEVLRYMRRYYDGKRILIDMGTEAPLVYDSGLAVKEFVYNEGGESAWHDAMQNPEPVVGWFCTQKGDAIWKLMQADPDWGRGYSLAMKNKSYSFYRRKQ
jgi:hypothetical protein